MFNREGQSKGWTVAAIFIFIISFFIVINLPGCLTMGSGKNYVKVSVEGQDYVCEQSWHYESNQYMSSNTCKATIAKDGKLFDCTFDLDSTGKNFSFAEDCQVVIN